MREKSFCFFRNSTKNQPKQSACLSPIRMQTSLITLTITISLLLLYLLQTLGVYLLIGLSDTVLHWISIEALGQLFTILLYPTAFFLPFLGLAKLSSISLWEMVKNPPDLSVCFAATGICLGCSVLLEVLLSSLRAPMIRQSVSFVIADPLAAGLSVIHIVLLSALIEEIVYRGILLKILRPFGDWMAIFWCAVLFALMHRNPVQLPNAFLMGLLLGYFVVQTCSVWTGILIHLSNNLLVILWEMGLLGCTFSAAVLLNILRFGLLVCMGILGVYTLWKRQMPLKLSLTDLSFTKIKQLLTIFLHPSIWMLAALFGWIFYLGVG